MFAYRMVMCPSAETHQYECIFRKIIMGPEMPLEQQMKTKVRFSYRKENDEYFWTIEIYVNVTQRGKSCFVKCNFLMLTNLWLTRDVV